MICFFLKNVKYIHSYTKMLIQIYLQPFKTKYFVKLLFMYSEIHIIYS